jgi:hypothetical protein
MKPQGALQASQLEEFALLEEHPGFSPALKGEDAVVCDFHVGQCFLTQVEIAAQAHFDARQAALLLGLPRASAQTG